MLDAVDPHREKFGLKPFKELRGGGGGGPEKTLLMQQKNETVEALSKIAQPCSGVRQACLSLISNAAWNVLGFDLFVQL